MAKTKSTLQYERLSRDNDELQNQSSFIQNQESICQRELFRPLYITAKSIDIL